MRCVFLLFLRFWVVEVADVLLAPLSSSSLGSTFISGFFSSVSIGSCFGSTASGSSFFTTRGLVSSSCYMNTTHHGQLAILQCWDMKPSSDWCITLCLRKVNNHKSNVLFWTCDVSRAGWLVDGICNSNQGIKQKMALCLTCSRHKEASFHLLEITELSCKHVNIPPFLYPSASSQSCCYLLHLLFQVWLQCHSRPAKLAGSSAQLQRLGWALCYQYLLLPGITSRREGRDFINQVILTYKQINWLAILSEQNLDIIMFG